MLSRMITTVALSSVLISVGTQARAAVTLEWVTVGDVGNAGELTGSGPYQITCGGVDYEYRIGQLEVTNGQYRALLNAVATVGDPHGLYNTDGDGGGMGGSLGGIARSGAGTSENPWVYTAKDDDPNWDLRPVNFVSWFDALRFINWLHNGQPTGGQDAFTTEDGAYDLSLGADAVRRPEATVFLPSEDEWYKAAFYKGGGFDAGYWDYATASDTIPTREVPPGTDGVNGSALYDDLQGQLIGPPYYMNAVGAYTAKPSTSPYGTYDQNGNVAEWTEGIIAGTLRVRRGASWIKHGDYLPASVRVGYDPTTEEIDIGFRIASLPSDPVPTVSAWGVVAMTLLIATAATIVFARRRRVAG